jgi:hypothetical protein
MQQSRPSLRIVFATARRRNKAEHECTKRQMTRWRAWHTRPGWFQRVPAGTATTGLAVFGVVHKEEQACLVRLQTGTWRIGRSC